MAILAFACGLLASAGTAGASTTHDLSGTWSCCAPGSGGVATQTWTITSMDKPSGAFTGTGRGGSYTWPIRGTANGNAVTLTTGPYNELPSYTAVFTGTISADSKTISGSWDDNPTPPPSGTFTATRPSAPTPGDPGNSPNTGGDARIRVVAGDIYVADSSANSGTGAVYKVSPENGQTTLVHQGPPFAGIRDISFGPDGNLYVTDIGANAIHKIDLKNGTVTRLTQQFDPLLRNPWGIVYDPILGDFLVSDFFFGSLVRVDPKSGAVKRLLDSDTLQRPHSMALIPGQAAFVTNLKTQSVMQLTQVRGNWRAGTFKKGPFPALLGIAIATTSTGYRFFVTDSSPPGQAGGVYSWLDRGKPELIASGAEIGTPAGLGLSSDGKTLYIGSTGTSAGTGSLIAMNLADRKLKTVAGGFVSPSSIAVAPPKRVSIAVGTGRSGTDATPQGVTTTVTAPNQPVFASVAVSVGLPSGGFSAARASKAVRVRAVTASIPPGKKTKVKVRFSRSLTKKIKGALRTGKKVRAKLTVKATAASGASRKVVKRVSIK